MAQADYYQLQLSSLEIYGLIADINNRLYPEIGFAFDTYQPHVTLEYLGSLSEEDLYDLYDDVEYHHALMEDIWDFFNSNFQLDRDHVTLLQSLGVMS